MDITEITLSNGYKKNDNLCVKKEVLESSTLIVKEDAFGELENDNEMVAYRVVQVGSDTDNDVLPHIVQTGNTFNATPVQSTFQTVLTTTPVNGNLYVIGTTNNDIFATRQTNHVPIAPRTGPMIETVRTKNMPCYRDDRRRTTHNEIERKRRDKINNWIIKLSKIIPDCNESSKPGYDSQQSKGGILEKAYRYISELKEENEKIKELLVKNKKLASELSLKTKQLETVLRENKELKMLLKQEEMGS